MLCLSAVPWASSGPSEALALLTILRGRYTRARDGDRDHVSKLNLAKDYVRLFNGDLRAPKFQHLCFLDGCCMSADGTAETVGNTFICFWNRGSNLGLQSLSSHYLILPGRDFDRLVVRHVFERKIPLWPWPPTTVSSCF